VADGVGTAGDGAMRGIRRAASVAVLAAAMM